MSNTVPNAPKTPAPQNRPNENGTVSVQGYFKIFDPKTQKTIVEGRG
jgi:hypothetical protein